MDITAATTDTTAVTIITPNQLNAGATIPQALDNQYVPDALFYQIANSPKNFLSSDIATAKMNNAKSEFIRALLYSSQVVVNRAYLTNSKLVYQFYMPGDTVNAMDFATLLNQGVVVPYLFKEKHIFDEFDFDTSTEGQTAAQFLSQFIRNSVRCVRFSLDDAINQEKITKFTFNFRKYFATLPLLDDVLRTNMLGELSGGDHEITSEELLLFKKHLKELSRYVEDTFDEKGDVSRNDLYMRFLIKPGTPVSEGDYLAADSSQPFRLHLKKLIDLKYNTNLPDMLGRYSFTPTNMPTRSALQDDFQILDMDSAKVEQFLENDLDKLVAGQRRFMTNIQKAMILPSLTELSLKDVLRIRNFESWHEFIRLQNKILSDPLTVGTHYYDFQLAFEKLQTNISEWYRKNYDTSAVTSVYESFATIVLSIASQTIVFGMKDPGLISAVTTSVFPEVAKGISVKMMMNVIDPVSRKINKERSYSIEIMRNELEITVDEVKQLLGRSNGCILPLSASMVAEQDRS